MHQKTSQVFARMTCRFAVTFYSHLPCETQVTPTRGLTSSRKKAQKPPGSNGKGAADGVSARKRQRAEGEDPVEECDFLQEDASDDDEVQASDTDKPRSARVHLRFAQRRDAQSSTQF